MSEHSQHRSRTTASGAARRIAEEMAAKQAAEARRRRAAWLGTGVAVLAITGAVIALVALNRDDDPAGSPTVEASASAPAAAGEKPKVSAGTGALGKLTVSVLRPGTGPQVTSGQTVTVHYVGVTYKDGKEFDSSWNGGQPFTTQIGVGQVIKGWDQGIVGQRVGSRVQLDIPSELAYGDSGQVPGDLRFVVDILDAK